MTNSIVAYVLNAKKIAVYVLGIVAQVLALNVLPADVASYGYAVLAIASGIGIYAAKNVELDPVGDHGR